MSLPLTRSTSIWSFPALAGTYQTGALPGVVLPLVGVRRAVPAAGTAAGLVVDDVDAAVAVHEGDAGRAVEAVVGGPPSMRSMPVSSSLPFGLEDAEAGFGCGRCGSDDQAIERVDPLAADQVIVAGAAEEAVDVAGCRRRRVRRPRAGRRRRSRTGRRCRPGRRAGPGRPCRSACRCRARRRGP